MSASHPPSQPSEAFIRALNVSLPALRGYCNASLGRGDEAEEALQRTSITLWRKCGEWIPTTDFMKWAITVAKFEVLGVVRDRNRREARYVFDPDVVELMADEAAKSHFPRMEALETCLGRLSASNRNVLAAHYVHGHSIKEISLACGKGVSAVKVMLLRLRGSLRVCIEGLMVKGDSR